MKDRILLNISNHPSAEWPEEQIQAALRDFSGVRDLPHPPISPEMTSSQVYDFAERMREQVRSMEPASIHVMGEHTFCYALVRLLQEDGFDCLASTTIRSVERINDNEIRRSFVFSGFRPYPKID